MVQRMRTCSRAQHAVSTIIYWCPRTSGAGGGRGASRRESLAGQALQPAHDPNDHIGTLPRSSGVPSPSEFSPSCIKLWYPDAGAAPLSPVAAGNQVLASAGCPLSDFVNGRRYPTSDARRHRRLVTESDKRLPRIHRSVEQAHSRGLRSRYCQVRPFALPR